MMKHAVLGPAAAFLTALGAGGLMGCAATARPAGGGAAAGDRTFIEGPSATLVVHGMSCPLCAHNVDKQLTDIPGVRSVSVDMGSGNVGVSFAEGARVTRGDLADAVHRSGFTLEEVRVP